MSHRIHFNTKYIPLHVSIKRVFEKYSKSSKPYDFAKCFVPIKKIKDDTWDMSYQNYKIVTFAKEHVDVLNLVHTLAYLLNDNPMDTCGMKQSPLIQTAVLDNFGHNYAIEVWETEDGEEVCLKIPKDVLYNIQYGFGCTMAYKCNLNETIMSMKYPWIVRALEDPNEVVFRHGVRNLVNLLLGKKYARHSHKIKINEKTARLLPTIFYAIGNSGKYTKGYMKAPWSDLFFNFYREADNPVIQSCLAILLQPSQQHPIYISKRGYMKLKMQILRDVQRQETNVPKEIYKWLLDAKETNFGYNFSTCQDVWYHWFVTRCDKNYAKCEVNVAYDMFLDVYIKRNTTKQVKKKRKRVVPHRSKTYNKQFDQTFRFHEKVKEYTRKYGYGYQETEHVNIRDGIYFLCDFICHVEGQNFNDSLGRLSIEQTYTPSLIEYHQFKSCHYGGYHEWNAFYKKKKHTDINYSPMVSYPSKFKFDVGCASDSFPMLKLDHGTQVELDKHLDKDKIRLIGSLYFKRGLRVETI